MSSAIISPSGTYRYTLRRDISLIQSTERPCLFIMLNPSTADATVDDPTIRRCIGFAKREQCTSMTVVNLFALRSPDPRALLQHADPIGPENDLHLREQLRAHERGLIIAAWGAHKQARPRVATLRNILADLGTTLTVHALGLTQDGHPRHPLYVEQIQPLIALWGSAPIDRPAPPTRP
jgi:hypothetical protein